MRLQSSSHAELVGVDVEPEALEHELVELLLAQAQRHEVDVRASSAAITARSSRSANSAILARSSRDSGLDERQTTTSGGIPMRRSSLTECCVGLVLSSPAASMIGTSVTCT